MIILDTNIISEMMRDDLNGAVAAWIDTVGRLHASAATLAETDDGIARLPEGSRRDRRAATAAAVLADFHDVILPFDARAARRYGGIVADRERGGRPIATADAQIAAICASRQAALATRNTADFEATDIRLFNPGNS